DTEKPATDFSTAKSVFICTGATCVSGGATANGIDIALRLGGGSISGRITRQDNGQPIRINSGINIRGPWPRTSSIGVGAFTDANGNYTVNGLPAGQYIVEVNPVQTPDGTAIGFYPY